LIKVDEIIKSEGEVKTKEDKKKGSKIEIQINNPENRVLEQIP